MSRVLESSIRSLSTQEQEIVTLLDFLPVLYPGGEAWLTRALDHVRSGAADGFEARVGGSLAGVVLGARKPNGRYKIRTLYVAPEYRDRTIGRQLLRKGIAAARKCDADRVYITVAATVDGHVAPLLLSEGFNRVAIEPDRYGPGRDEVVYELNL